MVLRNKFVKLERDTYQKVRFQNQFSQYIANRLINAAPPNYESSLDLTKVLGLSQISSTLLATQNSTSNISFLENLENLVQLITLTANRKFDLIVDISLLHVRLGYEIKRKILKSILVKCLTYRSQEMTYITISRSDLLIVLKFESPSEESKEILTVNIQI